MDDANAMVARNVRRFRQERQLSLGDLARISGLSKQTLSKVEQGIGNPTVDTLAAISEALDISLRRLVTEWGTPVFVQRSADAEWSERDGGGVRVLDQIYGSGYVRTETFRLHRTEHPPATIDPHSPGTLHHVYVIQGRIRIGPVDEPVELAPGDFVRFPGDVAHVQRCLTDEAVLHVVTTVPQVPQFGPAIHSG
jgi:transcriptional regulator with XRE-family HTH domain